MIDGRTRRAPFLLLGMVLGLAVSGCRVGPQYVRPAAPSAPEFKEPRPDNFKSEDGWKSAQPSDAQLRGVWWTLFDDSQLNTLEAQIDPANQTLKEADANFRAARAAVRFNRASEAPTIGVAPAVGAVRDSNHQPYLNISGTNNGEGNFILPFDLDYEIDLWGRVRRTVAQSREEAQGSAADLETSRLSLHAELAFDYFDLRSADAQSKLLDDTVKAFQSALQLTEDRYNGCCHPARDVRTRNRRPHWETAGGVHFEARPNQHRPARDSRHPGHASFAVAGTPPGHRLGGAEHGGSQRADRHRSGGLLSNAVALGSRRFRGHIRGQLALVAEPLFRRWTLAVSNPLRSWPPSRNLRHCPRAVRWHSGRLPPDHAHRIPAGRR
jgi:hypothetical protein